MSRVINMRILAASGLLALSSYSLAHEYLSFDELMVAFNTDFDATEVQSQEIGEGLYFLRGAGGNVVVSIGDQGVLMVDSQYAPMVPKLKSTIAELGGGGIDFAGFTPAALREKTCLMFNTIGPDRARTMADMLGHFDGCRLYDAEGRELGRTRQFVNLPRPAADVGRSRLGDVTRPIVRERRILTQRRSAFLLALVALAACSAAARLRYI